MLFNIEMDFEPKIYRTIVFVRHGQYQKGPEKLTSLGRQQARIVAKALKPLQASKLFCSTMPRAKETAKIISTQVKLKPAVKGFFREGRLPGTNAFNKKLTSKKSRLEKSKIRNEMRAAKLRADIAFKYLFRPPSAEASCEIVVAHGNVIRYWVCKALKISPEKWLSMDASHTSLTTIRINQKGKLVLLGFADKGHLPHKMRTYV